jgi:hypothetical protein
MKKIIISTFLCLGMFAVATAQEQDGNLNAFVTKRGISYLPEAGDFALGVDAAPFLKYLGNLFNQAGTNEAPTFGNEYTIYGKYFIADNQAIRAQLALNFSKTKDKQTVPNDYELLVNPTNVNATAVDVRNNIDNNIELRIGYELRRGKGRLQGFYGIDALVGYGNEKTSYDYANPITQANQSPSTADFAGGTSHMNNRLIEKNEGSKFAVGLGAFVGVEYFITSLISIGGEVGFDFRYGFRGQTEETSERFLGNEVQQFSYRTREVSSDPAFKVGIDTRPQGTLFLMFHF